MPNRNRLPVAVFASAGACCAVLAVVAGVFAICYTVPATYEVGCALGEQQYCTLINTIATIRFLAFIALVALLILGGVFILLAIVYARQSRRPGGVPVIVSPMAALPSMLLFPPPATSSAPPSGLPPPNLEPLVGMDDRAVVDVPTPAPLPVPPIPTPPQAPSRGPRGFVTNPPKPLILSALGVAVLLVVLGGILVLSAVGVPRGLKPLSFLASPTHTPSPTATPQPESTAGQAPTPLLNYSAPVPGPVCGSPDWTTDVSYPMQCTSSGLLMTNPANASTQSETDWIGLFEADTPPNYSIEVTVSQLSAACGGIGAQDVYGGETYVGYVCSNGTWSFVQYDFAAATLQQLGTGSVTQQNSYLIEITSLDDRSLQFHIGTTTLFSVPLPPNYFRTESVVLYLYAADKGQPGQGYFKDFVYQGE